MLNTGFSPWPSFTDEEAAAVARVLLSNRVNAWTGGEVDKFVRAFADWTGSRHAVALSNGTVALDAAMHALDVRGAEVIVTPRTFVASATAILMAGATPVFADVDGDTQNVTAESIAAVMTSRTRAIVAVHLAGWPCEMDAISALARDHHVAVVEDCAQAHGARFRGQSVGTFGTLSAWSFCQDKIMTTGGEGGMVTTQNEELWNRVWSYKDHGKNYNSVNRSDHPPGFRWLHDGVGTNGRMLEMQAVIGQIQLGRMSVWHAARTRNAERILAACRESPGLRVPVPPAHVEHAWYRAYAFVQEESLRSDWSRDRIAAEIVAMGVPCYSGSCPEVYLEKAFEGAPGRPKNRLPVAKKLGETSLMFLVHPTLTDAEVTLTERVVRTVMKRAAR